MKTFEEWWEETSPRLFTDECRAVLGEQTIAMAKDVASLAWDTSKLEQLSDDVEKLAEAENG